MVRTRGATKAVEDMKKIDSCGAINPVYATCTGFDTGSVPKIKTPSKIYNAFVRKFLKQSVPYTGKRVFIVTSRGEMKFVCPNYKVKVDGNWYSVSLTENGYMYMHILKEFVDNLENCVYKGDHITIAPTRDTHIHFHITRVQAVVEDKVVVSGKSYNASVCTLPLLPIRQNMSHKKSLMIEKRTWFDQQICESEHNGSINQSTSTVLFHDSYMADLVFKVLQKGFA
jgi:hypothetical protein